MFISNTILVTATATLCMLVGSFCLCLFVNQLLLIKRNSSFIDNLQRREDNYGIELELATKLKNDCLASFQKKTFFDRLAEVMGDRNVLWWLVPISRLDEASFEVE